MYKDRNPWTITYNVRFIVIDKPDKLVILQ
jgi:hypothetical protein